MKVGHYIMRVLPRIPLYGAIRRGRLRATRPLTLTFSVTGACQSRCKTCHIGSRYLDNPRIAAANLSPDEIEAVFRSVGPVYFFNVSGGEPFMRPDLAEVVRLACRHLRPQLIHIPTNGIAPRFIVRTTREILAHMDELLPASVPLSVKPSIDGIGSAHDAVRGFEGNFALLERSIDGLLELRRKHPRLHVDLGTVISNWNLEHLDAIERWVHGRGVQSYRHEIAEQRAEFHNLGDPITPTADVYRGLIGRFKARIRHNIAGKRRLTRITEAVRLVYYDVAADILEQRRQVSACYAGTSNVHLNYDGELWPCCVLGGEQSMGNVRDSNYDVLELLRSSRAQAARAFIAAKRCACPLANQWLTNVLLTPRHMMRVAWTLAAMTFVRQEAGEAEDIDPVPAADNTGRREALRSARYGILGEPEWIEFGAAEELVPRARRPFVMPRQQGEAPRQGQRESSAEDRRGQA